MKANIFDMTAGEMLEAAKEIKAGSIQLIGRKKGGAAKWIIIVALNDRARDLERYMDGLDFDPEEESDDETTV